MRRTRGLTFFHRSSVIPNLGIRDYLADCNKSDFGDRELRALMPPRPVVSQILYDVHFLNPWKKVRR